MLSVLLTAELLARVYYARLAAEHGLGRAAGDLHADPARRVDGTCGSSASDWPCWRQGARTRERPSADAAIFGILRRDVPACLVHPRRALRGRRAWAFARSGEAAASSRSHALDRTSESAAKGDVSPRNAAAPRSSERVPSA